MTSAAGSMAYERRHSITAVPTFCTSRVRSTRARPANIFTLPWWRCTRLVSGVGAGMGSSPPRPRRPPAGAVGAGRRGPVVAALGWLRFGSSSCKRRVRRRRSSSSSLPEAPLRPGISGRGLGRSKPPPRAKAESENETQVSAAKAAAVSVVRIVMNTPSPRAAGCSDRDRLGNGGNTPSEPRNLGGAPGRMRSWPSRATSHPTGRCTGRGGPILIPGGTGAALGCASCPRTTGQP